MTWLIGGISDNQINAVENVYGAFSTFGYLGQFSIAPAAKAEFAINEKNTVAVTAWIPLLSWVARSPYALNDDEYMKNNADHNGLKTFFRYVGDGNIQFINHFQKLNLDAEYQYRISEHWLAGAGYQFEFLRNSEPKTLIAYQHYFNLNITYQF